SLQVNRDAAGVSDEDIAGLRNVGLTDKGIVQLTHIVSDFASYNRLNLALQTDYDYRGFWRQLAFGDGAVAQGDGVLAFLLRPWVWPDAGDGLILFASGVASATGAFLISQAYRLCDAALAAPFEYASLPLAVLWGAFIFGERPDLVAWAGMALILGSGLYVAFRELQIDRARRRG
ncbi:MAG: EamA family transporter, partial [Gemmobacter sp.]